MSQPVICFDLDGPLVNERGEIHPRDVALLAQANPPAVFIPCTGRLRPAVHSLFARHGVSPNAPLPFPLVLQNGAALYGAGEALLSFHAFSDQIQRFFTDLILATPDVTFMIFSEDQVYVHWPTEFSSALVRRFDLEARPFHPREKITFSKVMALSEHPERLAGIAQRADRDGIEQSYSLELVLEFTPAGIHKGRGLRELLQVMGLWGSPLLVAGDGGNDLSMFELTPHTFTPQTAPADVQARASKVIDVAQSGLLEALLAEAHDR